MGSAGGRHMDLQHGVLASDAPEACTAGRESAPQASPGWPSALLSGQQGYAHSTTSLLRV